MPEELPPTGVSRAGGAAIAAAVASRPRLPPNIEGALWMLASALGFTVMTSLIKLLGDDYPAALQTFYRSAAGLIVLLPLVARDWRGAFRTTRPGILLFRSGVGTLAMIFSFYAFQKLPLAEANALSFTRTLWLVPLAFFILREPLGPWRIGAAVLGFAGVLVMLSPGFTGSGHPFGLAQLAALASAAMFAMTITGMKVMTRDHSPLTLLVYSAVLGVAFAVPPALFVWRWPSLPDLGLLTAMGVMGDAGAMAPIDYTRLVFTALVGFAVFHEIPGWTMIVGAVIVVVSTLIITLREQQQARAARRAVSD
jgi:drug/metabolite transporter (DMT)-like permease